MFTRCCQRDEDEVDFASLRRKQALGKVVRLETKATDEDDCSSTDSESVGEGEINTVTHAEETKARIGKKLSQALVLQDDEGNFVTPMDSLEQAKGVLESFADPKLQSALGDMIQTFLFGKHEQKLYVSACTEGNVAMDESKQAPDAEIAYRLSGSHRFCTEEQANHLLLEQELAGILKVQEFFKFVRNVNSIASNTKEPVFEDDLMQALSELLPQLSSLLGSITEEDSGDFWIDHDEDSKSVHVRMETILDVEKIANSAYGSVAETIKRAHSLDFRAMKVPEGYENVDKEKLRDAVKKKALNDFPAAIILKVLPARHAASENGKSVNRNKKRSKSKNRKHNCLLRLDFCIEENGHDLVWMNPRTCLPQPNENGQVAKVHFDEDDASYKGRCLLGFELTAGVSELGCATISLPKVIACLDYQAEMAIDGSGVAATIESTPIYIDWNRFVKTMARPLIDLGKLEKLLLHDFTFQVRIAPKSASLEDVIQRRGHIPGYGLFPDLPMELDPWCLQTYFSAKLVRPARIVQAFVRTYVASQVDDFGELILWRDLTVAFVSDLKSLCDSCTANQKCT